MCCCRFIKLLFYILGIIQSRWMFLPKIFSFIRNSKRRITCQTYVNLNIKEISFQNWTVFIVVVFFSQSSDSHTLCYRAQNTFKLYCCVYFYCCMYVTRALSSKLCSLLITYLSHTYIFFSVGWRCLISCILFIVEFIAQNTFSCIDIKCSFWCSCKC